MKKYPASVKNTLKHSEYANNYYVRLFDQVAYEIRNQVMDHLFTDVSEYKCTYRPASKKGDKYSDKSMYLWVHRMIECGRPTKIGVALKSGALVEAEVTVRYTGYQMQVVVDRNSIQYKKLDVRQKVAVAGLVGATLACHLLV